MLLFFLLFDFFVCNLWKNANCSLWNFKTIFKFFIKARTTLLLEIDPKACEKIYHLHERNHSVVSKAAGLQLKKPFLHCTIMPWEAKLSSFQEINVMFVSTDKNVIIIVGITRLLLSWASAHMQRNKIFEWTKLMDSAKLQYVQYNTDNLKPEGFQLPGLTESSTCHVTW